MQRNSSLPKTGGHSSDGELFARISTKQRIESLRGRFAPKSWTEKNAFWRKSALLSSYLFQAISLSLAAFGVYSIFHHFGASSEVAGILATVFLILIETTRRKAAKSISDKYVQTQKLAYGFAVLAALLFAASTLSSGYGLFHAIQSNAPAIEKKTDPVLSAMKGRVEDLQGNIEQLSRDTNSVGRIGKLSSLAILEFSKQLAPLQDSINKRAVSLQLANTYEQTDHESQILKVGLVSVLIYLFLEASFLGCMFFISLYDFRLYLELSGTQKNEVSGNDNLPTYPFGSALRNTDPCKPCLNFISPHFQSLFDWSNNGQKTARNKDFSTVTVLTKPYTLNGEKTVKSKDFSSVVNPFKTPPIKRRENDEKTTKIEIPEALTIMHLDKVSGKEKRMNHKAIKSNLAANKSRLRRASADKKESIQKQVEYWEGKESELLTLAQNQVA